MKYFTKEWYELVQRMYSTTGLKIIPDKNYSDKEIQAFYDSDLAEYIERDRRNYNTTPDYSRPDRLPFDPTKSIEYFEDYYRGMLRYGAGCYPDWVRETVDKRLLALERIPESSFSRLYKEESEKKQAFDAIMNEASAVLKAQNIPEEIKSQFHFHDSHVLALKKSGKDIELYLCKADGTTPPYIKIVFKNVSKLEREKGLVLRPKRESNGELYSNCHYWYDELYKTKDGYELHILLCATGTLRYLTICCEHIYFVDNIEINL